MIDFSRSILKVSGFLIGVISFVGCAGVSHYRKPDVVMENSWKQEAEDLSYYKTQSPVNQWWKLFNDPVLNELIQSVVDESLDVKVALSRIDEFDAKVGQKVAGLYPTINLSGTINRSVGFGRNTLPGEAETTRRGVVTGTWELDLFGRVRKGVKASKYDAAAAEADYLDVKNSVYKRISETYLGIRTAQARIGASMNNIDTQRKTLNLIKSRLKHGLASELDYSRAERLLARSESDLPLLRAAIYRDISNLAVLLGKDPDHFMKDYKELKSIPGVPATVNIGNPSMVIGRRPDVISAGMNLEAEAARVGVAKRAILPTLSIDGSWGRDSFLTDDKTWSIGSTISWDIFTGGRKSKEVKLRKALMKQASLDYKRVVLNALKEVKDFLNAVKEDRVRVRELERSVVAAKRSVKLSTDLYSKGLANLQTVLDAQKDQFEFENLLAVAKGDSAGNFVRLNVALGSGSSGDIKKATEDSGAEK